MQDVTNPVSLPSFDCIWDGPTLLDSMQYFIFHIQLKDYDALCNVLCGLRIQVASYLTGT